MKIPLLLLFALASAAFAADTPFDWNRARQLHARAERGETLSTDEQKILDEAKRRHDAGEPIPADTAAPTPAAAAPAKDSGFDWNRARQLFERRQRGETLTDDEKKFIEEAMRRHDAGERPGTAATSPPPTRVTEPAKHFTPLTELKEPYQGQDGGLYGGGKNEPPAAHAALAAKAIAQIQPLDAGGKPAPDGKVVLVSIGMSNTTMEFSTFMRTAIADPRKAAHIVIVDGAQGGKDAPAWATPDAGPWKVAAERIAAAQATAQQVQAVWIKQAIAGPRAGFPAETEKLRDRLRDIVTIAKQKYPNLRVAYLSSRIYAGYAGTALNPEPYAYESAFAVRWLIEEQMKGSPTLSPDAAQGTVKAPVLLWGPYLWADGRTPRAGDGLTWLPEDLGGDGTHPSTSGREKVAKLLLDFFTANPLAKPWFTGAK
jgi:hypothetical protein